MEQTNNNTQNDVIDLRELFSVLKRRKKLIGIVTGLLTVLAIVYGLIATPQYEAKAFLEIGDYKTNNNNNNNNKVLLDNASQLSKKLNILFIDKFKNLKERKSKVTSISVPKGQTAFLEIKSLATDNTLAKKEIKEILKYVQEKHKSILVDVKNRREIKIKNIESHITNIQNEELSFLNKKIDLTKKDLKSSNDELIKLTENLNESKNEDLAFRTLALIQKKDALRYRSDSNIRLIDLENTKNSLETSKINNLIEKKTLLQSMLLPYNYKNTQIIGDILTSDHPIKPKKKLIVIVAFITGLMLSVFLAFFLEFIGGMKREEDSKQ